MTFGTMSSNKNAPRTKGKRDVLVATQMGEWVTQDQKQTQRQFYRKAKPDKKRKKLVIKLQGPSVIYPTQDEQRRCCQVFYAVSELEIMDTRLTISNLYSPSPAFAVSEMS